MLNDLDDIYNIAVTSFDAPWERVSIEAEFYKDYSNVFVYEVERQVVGYIITWCIAREIELLTLAVDNRWRNKGIGKALMSYMQEFYDKNYLWHLEVACNNKSAICLYKSCGFEINSIITNYYGEGKDAYRMILSPNSNI